VATDNRTVDPIYVPFSVTTPPGTPIATPLATTIPIPHGWLEQVDLQIPPGHGGFTGIRFVLSGITILPYSTPGQWIVGNDLHQLFDVPIEVDTLFRVNTYNTGVYPHTHYVRFRLRQLPATAALPTAQLAPVAQLNAP
jgi:hypothetical protein